MTLRIFQVTNDGVAIAVPQDAVGSQPDVAQSGPAVVPPLPHLPGQKPPEPPGGSTEWERLRARLQQEPPRVVPPRKG
jgi:hypothetical protein